MPTNEKLQSFLSSTALVIDDEIIDESSTISKIVLELESQGTLFVKKRELTDSVESFSNISFVILDWDLTKKEEKDSLPPGVSLGAALLTSKKEEIINFIKNVIKNYFIPVFVFSREAVEDIKKCLVADEQLKLAIEKSKIFICNKNSLQNGQVIDSLNDWLNNSMAVYTFKIMDGSIEKAKHRFFNDMFECDPNWPCHVYQILKKDNPADINSDFQEFLMTSYVSTIEPIAFNAAGFDKQVTLDGEQLNKIFSKIKFLSYALDSNIGLHSGDIYFNDEEEKTEYIINVSAACDMRNKRAYFVFGEETSSPKTHDIVCTHTIKRILGKKGIEFHLNDAELLNIGENVNEINIQRKGKVKIYKRVGRLLNPYIIALQNKFSSYITRVGVFRES